MCVCVLGIEGVEAVLNSINNNTVYIYILILNPVYDFIATVHILYCRKMARDKGNIYQHILPIF